MTGVAPVSSTGYLISVTASFLTVGVTIGEGTGAALVLQ
jgi:hypothetical protein